MALKTDADFANLDNIFLHFKQITGDSVAGAILTLAFIVQNSPIGRTDFLQTGLEKLIPKSKQ